MIITLNEESNIQPCLDSVKWADEIIVVDSESNDQTVKIAKQYTETVFVRKWQGFARTKNYAIQQAGGEWVLCIDADEVLTPEAELEIREAIKSPGVDGYFFPRKANFLGRWIYHSGWYPGYVLRLIRRKHACYQETLVHEYLEKPEKTAKLNIPILHYTDPDIKHYFSKLNIYTSLAAEDLWKRGKQFRSVDLIIRPLHIWIKMYIFKAGFLDGFQGFLLAIFSGFYVFVKYAKLWEIQKQHSE